MNVGVPFKCLFTMGTFILIYHFWVELKISWYAKRSLVLLWYHMGHVKYCRRSLCHENRSLINKWWAPRGALLQGRLYRHTHKRLYGRTVQCTKRLNVGLQGCLRFRLVGLQPKAFTIGLVFLKTHYYCYFLRHRRTASGLYF